MEKVHKDLIFLNFLMIYKISVPIAIGMKNDSHGLKILIL